MRVLKAFGRFWYDFVIGDDWKLAVLVVTSLALTLGAFTVGLVGPSAAAVLGAGLLVVGFVISSVVDVRRS